MKTRIHSALMWTRLHFRDGRSKLLKIVSTVLMSTIERGKRGRTNRQTKGQVYCSNDADSTDIQFFTAGTYQMVDFWGLTKGRIAKYRRKCFGTCCFPLQSDSRLCVDIKRYVPPIHWCQLWVIRDVKRQKTSIFFKFSKHEYIIKFLYRWSNLNI